MCTVTLSYNKNNALARRKLAALLNTGLFTQVTPVSNDHDELRKHREERDAFMAASKRNMAHFIARHL